MNNLSLAKSKSAKITLWQWLFLWLMLDSLILYLLRPFFFFPINGLLPVLVAMAFLFEKSRSNELKTNYIVFWSLIALGLSLAIVLGVESPAIVSKQFATALSAFIIGLKSISTVAVSDRFIKLISFISLIYALVCTAALLGVSRVYLPVSYLSGFNDGVAVIRAEITTDQNYQVFYLFPLLLSLAVKQSIILRVLQLLGLFAALFVIVEMETRSGLLVMAGFTGMMIFLPFWYRRAGSALYVLLFVLGLLLIGLIKLPLIIELSQGMVRRFTTSDLSTFWGRIHSLIYLFQHLLDPSHWVPKGQGHFLLLYGNYPHSSPTSIYLMGGIFSLCGWALLLFGSLISAVRLLFKKRVPLNEAAIVLAGFSALIICLTLPAALFEQLWLWAGGSAGVVLSHNYRRIKSACYKKECGHE